MSVSSIKQIYDDSRTSAANLLYTQEFVPKPEQ